MSIWINAIGVGCIGCVYGYLLFYSFKRHFQPVATEPLPLKEVVTVLAAVGAGGALGAVFIALEGINYIGPYGIGLFIGVVFNIVMTLSLEQKHHNRTG
ncbi:MAG: hypothetical protein AAF902_07845 [Chloroflexota bacterium]